LLIVPLPHNAPRPGCAGRAAGDSPRGASECDRQHQRAAQHAQVGGSV